MKTVIFLGLLISTSMLLEGCSDSNDPGKLLSGKIDGLDYTFKYAKSNFDRVQNIYEVRMFGESQGETDPCSIIISDKVHLTLSINNSKGVYQIPADLNVFFELDGNDGSGINATSGFLEILEISGIRTFGYLQALYDQNNSVEGSFAFDRCD